jgi:hypothetical protein
MTMHAGTENHARYLPGKRSGHYESFFVRANHPSRPLAFWIRYTLFSPEGRPEAGLGELWAIVFDGEKGEHGAYKREVPIARAHFDRFAFDVRVDGAHLGPGALSGAIDQEVSWDLRFRAGETPLFLFPAQLYETHLPKAKQLTPAPLAVFDGAITAGGRVLDVGGWVGAQSHNWGWKQTDEYAWVQVAGFDGHPHTFFEMATGRIKLGPVWSPRLSPLVLRHHGREHAFRSIPDALHTRAGYDYTSLTVTAEDAEVRIAGHVTASPADFVGLAYADPPGGVKQCLNTKIAACDLTISYKAGPRRGEIDQISSGRRAAFEILTDDGGHGIPIRV